MSLSAPHPLTLAPTGSQVHCMDPDSYEQLAVERDIFGSVADFLKEGLEVTLNFHGEDAVTGEVPTHVTLQVEEAAPTMKGETAAPSYKKAVCEGGVEVRWAGQGGGVLEWGWKGGGAWQAGMCRDLLSGDGWLACS